MTWVDSVSQALGPASLTNVAGYAAPAASPPRAPLDRFYIASQDILRIGTPSALSQHAALGPLLLVGLCSITENYFRDVFALILRICPIAQATASDQSVKLGSVVWYAGGDMERGAFEHMSFAGAENLLKTAKVFLDFQLRKTSVYDEFDKVCELRHSIVHASSVLGGRNAVSLQLAPTPTPLQVVVGFSELQQCAAICTALAVSVNRDLFFEMARRWARVWPLMPSWQASRAHSAFRAIWDGFHSRIDAANLTIPDPMTIVRCKNQVLRHKF